MEVFHQILNRVLTEDLSVDALIEWILFDREKLEDFGDDARRDFVPLFLHHLREETGRTLQRDGTAAAAAAPGATTPFEPRPVSDQRPRKSASNSSRSLSFSSTGGGGGGATPNDDARRKKPGQENGRGLEKMDHTQSAKLNERMQGRRNRSNYNERNNKNGDRNGGGARASNDKRFQPNRKSPPLPPPPNPENVMDFPSLKQSSSTSPLEAVATSASSAVAAATPKRRIRPTLVAADSSAKVDAGSFPLLGDGAPQGESPVVAAAWTERRVHPVPSGKPPKMPTGPTNTRQSGEKKSKKRAVFRTLSPIAPVRSASWTEKENVPPLANNSAFGDSDADVSTLSNCSSLIAPSSSVNSLATFEGTNSLLTPTKPDMSSRGFTTPVKNKSVNEPPDLPSASSTPLKSVQSSPGPEFEDAVLSKVTKVDQLARLASLYGSILREGLATNLAAEIYYLADLVTACHVAKDLSDSVAELLLETQSYLHSIHNIVFFAVKTLSLIKEVLSIFDGAAVKLIADNKRIAAFEPALLEHLEALKLKTREDHETSLTTSKFGLFSIHSTPGVPFQPETDDRSNFTCDRSFHHFKKVRDNFYELLREWQDSHASAGWTIWDAMGSKIGALVRSTYPYLATRVHFARLFKSQLLLMCATNPGGASSLGDSAVEDNALLSDMRRTNPEKYNRLKERFVKPAVRLGPAPPPAFSGIQEFFRDFVVVADCDSFNRLLSDSIHAEILCLEGSLDDFDEESEDESEENSDKLSTTLTQLTILAKFYGFLKFLPYRSATKLPSAIQAELLDLRQSSSTDGAVDFFSRKLDDSMSRGRLVLNLPWIVAFLSQMDAVSLKMSPALEILRRLKELHSSVRLSNRGAQILPPRNQFLLTFTIGWVFDVLNLEYPEVFPPNPRRKDFRFSGIDASPVIGDKFFSNSFSFLNEIKAKFAEFSSGTNKRNCSNAAGATVRKITPLSMSFNEEPSKRSTPSGNSEKQLHRSIRESFFSLHQASLKKSVEFVAERVSSKCIKRLKHFAKTTLLPGGKEKLRARFSNVSSGTQPVSQPSQFVATEVAALVCGLQTERKTFAEPFCSEEIKSILPSLLSPELDAKIVEFSVTISLQTSVEKVESWVATYLDFKYFEKELSGEWDKLNKNVNKPSPEPEQTSVIPGNEIVHDETRSTASEILISFKETFQTLIVRRGYHSDGTDWDSLGHKINRLFLTAYDTCRNRDDVSPSVYKNLSRLSVDLTLYFFDSHVDGFSSQADILSSAIRFWAMPELKTLVTVILEGKVSNCKISAVVDFCSRCIKLLSD